jgi:hypothetical protein
VHGLVRAEARDEESAQNLRDVVRGFLALARIQGARSPDLKGTLNSMELGGTGKVVSLSFDVTPGLIDFLGSGRAGRSGLPRRPPPPLRAPQVFLAPNPKSPIKIPRWNLGSGYRVLDLRFGISYVPLRFALSVSMKSVITDGRAPTDR